jgi:hypothetical protein
MITTTVIVLDLVTGAAAVGGGVYLVAGARRLSPAWLRSTPFTSFLWPGLLLLVPVGGSLLAAAALLLVDAHNGRLVSVEAGVILTAWSAMLLTTAGYRHWLQVLSVGVGVAIVVLSLFLPAPG